MSHIPKYANEAELVADFCKSVSEHNRKHQDSRKWVVYPETCDWDLLLVNADGVQIGIEAKMAFNPKVLSQAISDRSAWSHWGPDYRAVLVPRVGLQQYMSQLAKALGVVVIIPTYRNGVITNFSPFPVNEDHYWENEIWQNWCPARRCPIPDYVPDVTGGKPSPLKLTEWKISAIKLTIVLDKYGYVTRDDMKALRISHYRWTDRYTGFLLPSPMGYIRSERTPDFKKEHPTNYAQIEADFEKWNPRKGLAA